MNGEIGDLGHTLGQEEVGEVTCGWIVFQVGRNEEVAGCIEVFDCFRITVRTLVLTKDHLLTVHLLAKSF